MLVGRDPGLEDSHKSWAGSWGSDQLRFLQERKITRFGGVKEIPVDVQVVFATWKNLEEESAKGLFRHDLLNRIKGYPVRIPSLNERRDDIPLLVEFLCKAEEVPKAVGLSLSKEALAALKEHHWTANVRELIDVLRAVVLDNPQATAPWQAGEDAVRAVLGKGGGKTSTDDDDEGGGVSPPPNSAPMAIMPPEPPKPAPLRDQQLAAAVAMVMKDQGQRTASGWVPLFSEAEGIPIGGATQHARRTRAGLLLKKLEGTHVKVGGQTYQISRTYQYSVHKRPFYGLHESKP